MEESVELFELSDFTCAKCKKPIGDDQITTAVMICVYVPQASAYVDEGPYHAECGKARSNEISSTFDK